MALETTRTWTRRELEQAAEFDPHERTMLRVAISPKLLLAIIEFQEQRGERIEMLSAYGDPDRCELRFYRR